MSFSQLKITFLALFIPSFFGCGGEKAAEPNFNSSDRSDANVEEADHEEHAHDGDRDQVMVPPKGYYDSLFAETINELPTYKLADEDQVLFVNFDGEDLTRGFSRGQSFILCKANATVPPSGLSAADREDILTLVVAHYTDANAKLSVTDSRPTTGDFTTIHVGGAYSDLGCRGQGVLGVAPFDRGNTNRNDIGFAFTQGINSNRIIAETISHEAGHSFGLDHITNQKGLMYASVSPQIEGFRSGQISGSIGTQDSPVELRAVLGSGPSTGVSAPGATPAPKPTPVASTPKPAPVPGLPNLPTNLAGLPGLGQIVGVGNVLPGLNASQIPDISQILPTIQGIVPVSGANLTGIDQILAVVGVAGIPAAGGAAQGPFDISQATNLLGGLAGANSPIDLNQLLNLAGGGNGGNPLDLLTGLLGGGGLGNLGGVAGNNQIPSLNQLPDLSQLLGLAGGAGGIPDITTLISSLRSTGAVVNSNYSNPQTQNALRSLLTVGYSQAYNAQP